MSVSKTSTSSPSFPSAQQVSGDIFFQVKKEILDKLDIILQKVNLQVIEYLKPQGQRKEQKKNFRFIELSEFENQIQTLFDYLDRLYESLNTSVSFTSNDVKNTVSSPNSNLQSTGRVKQSLLQYNTALANQLGEIKLKYQHLEEDMHRLRDENQHMMFLLKTNLSRSHSLGQSFNHESKSTIKNYNHNNKQQQFKEKESLKSSKSVHRSISSNQANEHYQQPTQPMQGISLETVKKILRFYNHSICQMSLQYKETVKEIKKILKQVKFQIIQSRVQCISELKKWTEKVQNQTIHTVKKDQSKQISQPQEITPNQVVAFQSKQNELKEQYCGEVCFKKYYMQRQNKQGFQENILSRIQQILDVC